jgi:hypothetical protein
LRNEELKRKLEAKKKKIQDVKEGKFIEPDEVPSDPSPSAEQP